MKISALSRLPGRMLFLSILGRPRLRGTCAIQRASSTPDVLQRGAHGPPASQGCFRLYRLLPARRFQTEPSGTNPAAAWPARSLHVASILSVLWWGRVGLKNLEGGPMQKCGGCRLPCGRALSVQVTHNRAHRTCSSSSVPWLLSRAAPAVALVLGEHLGEGLG